MDAADRRVPLRRFREEVREFHDRPFLPMIMGYWQKARPETGARASRPLMRSKTRLPTICRISDTAS